MNPWVSPFGDLKVAKKKSIPELVRQAHERAVKSRSRAYAPYSKFKVGAAVVSKGKIYSGCNVENASYGGTICAERNAIFHAVEQGAQSFDHVVIVADTENPTPPCGFCRQVMAEFCSPKTQVWLGNEKGITKVYDFATILPEPFGPSYLKD